MSVIKLRNVSNTRYLFSEIGGVIDLGNGRTLPKGKKVGCTPNDNILVTNEDEIKACGLLQQLIAERKLVPIQQQGAPAQQPVVQQASPKLQAQEGDEYSLMQNLINQAPEPDDFSDTGVSSEDSVNLIAGDEDDARELQAYLNSEERVEAAKAKTVVTQQPLARPDQDLKAPAEPSQPDPKGANGTDLFYEQPPRDILVDDPRPPSNLYEDFSEKKNTPV